MSNESRNQRGLFNDFEFRESSEDRIRRLKLKLMGVQITRVEMEVGPGPTIPHKPDTSSFAGANSSDRIDKTLF